MKGYRFRLEAVLRVRRIQEEQTRAAMASARAEVQAAQIATSRRDRAYRAAFAGESAPSAGWRAERDRRERLARAVLASRAAEIHLHDIAAGTSAEWEEAARRLAALEHLDEAARRQHRAEQDAAEQRDLDELATTRHGRRPSLRRPTPNDEEFHP